MGLFQNRCWLTAAGLATVAAGFSGTPALAKADPLVLKPSSKWHLDYSPDSCRLARQYGEGDDEVLMVLTRYDPGVEAEMLLSGKPLRPIQDRSEADITFGPQEETLERDFVRGELGDRPMMLVLGTFAPWKLSEEEEKRREAAQDEGIPSVEDEASNAARFASMQWIEVDASFIKPIRMETGPLDKPFAAFNKCMDELVHHWGVDVDRYKARIRNPKPVNSPGKWVVSKDYPSEALRSGQQAVIHFRLSVDAEGRVSDCHIQGGNRRRRIQGSRLFRHYQARSLRTRARRRRQCHGGLLYQHRPFRNAELKSN